MAEPTRDQKIEDSVINAIKSGNAQMRSRWFFAARGALFTLVIFILFAALLYLTSFIIFALQQNGIIFAPSFGWAGWAIFLSGLPWGLLLLSLLLILVLASLLRRYEFIYHHPLFYAIFLFVIIIIAGSFWIAATSFQRKLFEYSTQNLPLLGQWYQFEIEGPSSIHRGTIVAVGQNSFVMADAGGVTSTVVAAPGVIFSRSFQAGDTVVVFGNLQRDGNIEAFGVERTAP